MSKVCSICCVFVALILVCKQAHSKGRVSGYVRTQSGEALSFATIYDPASKRSTTSNEIGYYELDADSSRIHLHCVLIGYVPYNMWINVSAQTTHHIILTEQAYQLGEVQISGSKEDPAFAIMRKAISYRPLYLKEPLSYSCRTYIKGMQRLTTVPKKILLMEVDETIKPGIFYLSESLSDVYVKQPNLIKEVLISSKVSGDNEGFTFNRAGAIRFNMYENILPSFGLNQRGFISPVASNALLYYNYKLDGTFSEAGYTIYRIKLIPKRKHDPVFKGYIFVIKDLWRIYSTDMYLDPSSQIEFVDTLRIRQEYTKQPNGVWMPTAQRFIFSWEAFGFKGNGYFVVLNNAYKIQSAYKPSFYGIIGDSSQKQDSKPSAKSLNQNKKIARRVAKQNKLERQDSGMFAPDFFTREVLTITDSSNKTSDSIWELNRPIPLTDEERTDYKEKDSLTRIEESESYQDSMDRISNKLEWTDLLIGGYTYSHSYTQTRVEIKPLTAMIQFNTVEGLVVAPEASFTKTYIENKKWVTLTPAIRYGFSSNRVYGTCKIDYYYNAILERKWSIEAGQYVAQFNPDNPISPFLNTAYTLLLNENYLKLYEQSFLRAAWQSELVNGISFNASASYAQRKRLSNTTDFSFAPLLNREFTSNDPVSIETQHIMHTHRALTVAAELEFVFAQRYISRPDMRIRFRSKYPVLTVGYKGGIPLASVIRYDLCYTGATWQKNLKLLGTLTASMEGGYFTNTKRMEFPDYKHFNGNLTEFATGNFRAFQLMDYYQNSTQQYYITGSYVHHFNGFWFNKVPFLRKLKWQEVFSAHVLHTPAIDPYVELGAGIEHIFKIVRVDYFQVISGSAPVAQGIRIGLGF